MKKQVHVAAAIITRPDGRILLGQRAPGSFYPGYWEFPGGKVEAGETPRQALIRELREELGLEVDTAWPWISREHLYEHAHVHLHFFEVPAWHGEIRDHVHSALSWEIPDKCGVAPILPANGPIMKALTLPRFMGITQAARLGSSHQLAALDGALARGLKLVQVREPDLHLAEGKAFAAQVVDRCRPHGALVLINGEAPLVLDCAADGLHLPARQLTQLRGRPDFPWVGASCHSRHELELAAGLGLDYALLGPVCATPTHPQQAGLGWETFCRFVADLPMPVFALGGLGPKDLVPARTAGAHGIAGIRSAW